MLGVFDSGIGGLTVVRELIKAVPRISFVYFGDTARTPYGTKSPAVIKQYALEDAQFLLSQGAQAIVTACNTASSVAILTLTEKYPKVPIFAVVRPAVAEALRVTKTGRIGVIGTRATINSGIYERLLKEGVSGSCHGTHPAGAHPAQRDCAPAGTPVPCHPPCHPERSRGISGAVKVYSVAAPLLVPLVEEGWLKKPDTKRILKQYLGPLKRAQVDTLILGCTHFPLLKNLIAPIMGKRVKLVDPAEAVAREVATYVADHPEFVPDQVTRRYIVSDRTPRFQEVASHWLGEQVVLEEKC